MMMKDGDHHICLWSWYHHDHIWSLSWFMIIMTTWDLQYCGRFHPQHSFVRPSRSPGLTKIIILLLIYQWQELRLTSQGTNDTFLQRTNLPLYHYPLFVRCTSLSVLNHSQTLLQTFHRGITNVTKIVTRWKLRIWPPFPQVVDPFKQKISNKHQNRNLQI